jgi:hypothetical protein
MDIANSKGLQTTADLVAATPHDPSLTAIVHPTQISVESTGDFVGWGTKKGKGTNVSGAISNCPTNLGDRWLLYVDGRTFTRYFCRVGYGDEPNVAPGQRIEIIHTSCLGSTRWAFKWNGTLKTCQAINGVAGKPIVGGESLGYDPQHIDIHYTLLKYRVLGGTWTAWVAPNGSCVSVGYHLLINGTADVWAEEL